MAIPINPLSDREVSYKSKVDYLSLRDPIACPVRYTLFLTNGCNMTCCMCTQPVVIKEKWKFMPLEIISKILDETIWTYPTYTLFGGEPLLHPHLEEILTVIRHKGAKTEIVTNGFYLARYAQNIIDADCDLIISMSGDERTHNMIKNNKQSYRRIEEGLSAIEEMSSDFLREKVSVNCVLLPDNLDGVNDLIEEIKKWGIGKITFQHPQWLSKYQIEETNKIWQSQLYSSFNLSMSMHKSYDFDEDFVRRLLKLKDYLEKEKYGMDIQFFPDFSDSETWLYYSEDGSTFMDKDAVCLMPWLSPMIDESGNVYCCIDHPIGNIMNTSFWSIWNGDKNRIFRNRLVLHKKYPVCSRCCIMYQRIGEYEK